jgi:peptidoglycan/LPS O-acetylase OafA/YrhL
MLRATFVSIVYPENMTWSGNTVILYLTFPLFITTMPLQVMFSVALLIITLMLLLMWVMLSMINWV